MAHRASLAAPVRRPGTTHRRRRTIAGRIRTLKEFAAHRRFITGDTLGFDPWPGRAAQQIAQYRDGEENLTPRIPEQIMAPMLKAALFYVTTAGPDILAARTELCGLDTVRRGRRLHAGQPAQLLQAFIDQRRQQGRGIPAMPVQQHHLNRDAPIIDGVVQAPNYTLIWQMAGLRGAWNLRPIVDAVSSLAVFPTAELK